MKRGLAFERQDFNGVEVYGWNTAFVQGLVAICL